MLNNTLELSLLTLITSFLLIHCNKMESPLDHALRKAGPAVQEVLKDKDQYEIQIRLTEVLEKEGEVEFRTSSFQEDDQFYFYPASTAKLPVAILALQKLRELQLKGYIINANTPFEIISTQGNVIEYKDTTALNQKLTIAHLIKKIFLVSDNDAYNYLFDFLGRDYINNALHEVGLQNTHLYHKFLFGADNINTWEYRFYSSEQDTLYFQSTIQSTGSGNTSELKSIFKGEGYVENGITVAAPFDFRNKNRIALSDLEGILKRLFYPDSFEEKERFSLLEEDLEFLRFWMSRTTLESTDPNYNYGEYYDSYVKFFIYGDTKGQMSDSVRIYNKVGFAYGTVTDAAYIVDQKTNTQFFLSASILVNKNKIFYDDVYEFETIGIPFLAELGRSVLKELTTP